MQILVDRSNYVVAYAPIIEFGVYDEPIEKWGLFDEDGNILYYVINHNFTLVEDATLPEDFEYGKYFYENSEFVLNEEWEPYVPEASVEERIAQIEEQIASLSGDGVWDEMALAIEEGVNDVD